MREEEQEQQSIVTPIGITDWRDVRQRFGIRAEDRLQHIYAIGKTGSGKSTLLLNIAISDIEQGNGLAVIDPHGDVAATLLNYVPQERIKDVVYFNATDFDYSVSFNPLSNIAPKQYHLVTAGLIATFKKIWNESWGPRMEYILRYSILTLLHYPSATLLDIPTLLTDYLFRSNVLAYITDESILNFWNREYDKYTPQLRAEAIAPVLNKIGLFHASLPLRNIVGHERSTINIKEIMDEGKILICNLSKGIIGEDACLLLGSMLVTAIQVAALERANQTEEARKPFYLFVDELHSFVSLSFADILSEARKYKLGLFLTHQYIEQLHEKIRAAIFGNAGTIISFRIGAEDAKHVSKEFYPNFSEEDLVNLPKYSMYLRLMIDGQTSKPFSAKTLPLKPVTQSYKEAIIEASRQHFAVDNNTTTNTSTNNKTNKQQSKLPKQQELF